MKKILIAIILLALVGVGVSSYALWQHYAPLNSSFCNFGETFSCDLINKSAYSEVLGIPVALIGLVGYLAIVAFAMFALLDAAHCRHACAALLGLSIFGVFFSLFFTYIEFFVIGAACVLCIASQVIIIAAVIIAAIAWRSSCRTCGIVAVDCGR